MICWDTPEPTFGYSSLYQSTTELSTIHGKLTADEHKNILSTNSDCLKSVKIVICLVIKVNMTGWQSCGY